QRQLHQVRPPRQLAPAVEVLQAGEDVAIAVVVPVGPAIGRQQRVEGIRRRVAAESLPEGVPALPVKTSHGCLPREGTAGCRTGSRMPPALRGSPCGTPGNPAATGWPGPGASRWRVRR